MNSGCFSKCIYSIFDIRNNLELVFIIVVKVVIMCNVKNESR